MHWTRGGLGVKRHKGLTLLFVLVLLFLSWILNQNIFIWN